MLDMSGSTIPAIGECARLMATAPDSTLGIAAVLGLVGKADARIRRVELHDELAGTPPVIWTSDEVEDEIDDEVDDKGADGAMAPIEVPILAADVRIAALRIGYRADGSLPDTTAFAAVANLFTIALTRDAALRALQGELTQHVRDIALQRTFIERIIDSLPVSLYVVDRDYRIHVWNHTRESGAQGIARQDAIGRTIFDVMSRQPADRLREEFDEVFASGRLQQFQMETEAFGEPRLYRISKIPMRLAGDAVTHVITIGEDLTDWKTAMDRSAQVEKLAALGQLAAGVMHEINNPLATIAACVETMALQPALQPALPETGGGSDVSGATSLIRIIELEVERCKKIVNGLLEFSRPKATSHEPIDLSATTERALFLLQHHPRFKRARVTAALEPVGTLWVQGSADQLVQVLIALVMNALDATPEGGRVLVRTRIDDTVDGTPRAFMEVEDEGPGIPRAMQAKVFEPFFTTKPVGQGTGLGLAICYGIISDHGGTIELVQSDGPGAHFRVILPIQGVGAPVVA